MTGWKKGATIALLLAVIGVSAAIALKYAMRHGPAPQPHWVAERLAEKVDEKSLKVISLSLNRWEALGRDAQGRYKNPETGEYSMVPAMECPGCKQAIPMPMERASSDACPKCGKNPWAGR